MAGRLDDHVDQRRYYESLIAVSPTAIVTTDADFQVTSWNPAAERLFGFTAAEAIGRNVDDLVCNDEQVRAEGLEMDRLALRGASPKIHAPNPERRDADRRRTPRSADRGRRPFRRLIRLLRRHRHSSASVRKGQPRGRSPALPQSPYVTSQSFGCGWSIRGLPPIGTLKNTTPSSTGSEVSLRPA